MKDKVVPKNSQVKFKKTEVEDHHKISSISNKTKSVTAFNDSLKSKTSNVNVVCATCGKCMFNSNYDACVSKLLNDVNTRTKKPKVVTIITRKPKSKANKYVATPPKKIVASESTLQKSKSYYMMLYEKTNKACKWWIAQWKRIFKKRSKKKAKNKQIQAREGKDQVKSKSKVIKMKILQLEGLKLPSLKLYYKVIRKEGSKLQTG
ncbi:hypothetical protein Tco_1201935 [Tanacetum coccineum]